MSIGQSASNRCLLCGQWSKLKYEGLRDRLGTSREVFNLWECVSCGVGFINPIPEGPLDAYYPESYLSSEQSATPGKRFDIEEWYRFNQYRFDFNLVQKSMEKLICQETRYLDVGCGSGERLLYVKKTTGAECVGLDTQNFLKSNSQATDIEFIQSEVMDYYPSPKFDIVSLFQVLEHVPDPTSTLRHILQNFVTSDGTLVLQVPNFGSIERRIFGKRWFSMDAPRHLWQFNTTNLCELVEAAGGKVVCTFRKNALLHSISLVPSLFPALDVQKIWSNQSLTTSSRLARVALWAFLTVLSIPLVAIENLFSTSSMLTLIATRSDSEATL
jgi:2-polyprenyl-3-methyl-5-hydroxy-6-metoxy-1,4-benzoquinol methylase